MPTTYGQATYSDNTNQTNDPKKDLKNDPTEAARQRLVNEATDPVSHRGFRIGVKPQDGDHSQGDSANGDDAHRGLKIGGKPTTDKAVSDKPASDKPASDKPASDKPTGDKPPADTPPVHRGFRPGFHLGLRPEDLNLPPLVIENNEKPQPRVDAPPRGENNSSIERNEKGQIQSIDYGNAHKQREFTRSEDGTLTSIRTTENTNGQKSQSLIQRDPESKQWYAEVDGHKFYLKGDIELRPNGDLAFTEQPGKPRVETPGGQTFNETTTASGARVATNDSGQIRSITRADGSMVRCYYGGDSNSADGDLYKFDGSGQKGKLTGVDEYSADGKKTHWSNDGDSWKSDGKPPETRQRMEVQANGNVNFTDSHSQEHTVLGSGKEQKGKLQYEYDKEGRVTSMADDSGFKISNIKYKDGSQEIQSLQMQDKSGKVQTYTHKEGTAWSVTDQNGVQSKTDWHGEVKIGADGSYSCRDDETRNGKKADGAWSVWRADGTVTNERHNADGSIQQIKKDGSLVDVDAQGRVQKVTAASGDSRTFSYDEKGLSRVTDTNKKGTSTWQRDQQEQGKERQNIEVKADGTLEYSMRDGSKVSERTDASKVTHDGQGRITRVDQTDGSSRAFNYDGNGELRSITDARKNQDGTTKTRDWQAFKQDDGSTSLAYAGQDGKVQTRHNVKVDDSGSYSYLDEQGKDRTAKIGQIRDGSDFPFKNSDKADDAREKFLESVKPQMDEKRFARLQGMMKDFEKRESDLIEMRQALGDDTSKLGDEFGNKIAGTYDQMTALVGPGSNQQLYDQQTRVKLAENFMFHAADPADMNQGSKGSCWIQAGHIAGMIDHPDAMARLLTETALTGSYTSANGGERDPNPHTFNFNRNALAITHGFSGGADWSIDNANQSAARSPVGMIFDESLSMMAGRRTSNAGDYPTTRRLMYMVTGDVVHDSTNVGSEAETLMRHGAYITYAPNHMRTRQLRKEGDHWQIIQDDQHGDRSDRVVANITNLNDYLQNHRAYAANGPVHHHEPGAENIDTPFNQTTLVADNNYPNQYQPDQYPEQTRPARRFRILRRWR